MKSLDRSKRHLVIRHKVNGTSNRPRLSVYRSLNHLYVQLIDDTQHKTIVGLSDKNLHQGSGMERAKILGETLAEKAKALGITAVVFDRGGFRYHGQVKQIADTMRNQGITI